VLDVDQRCLDVRASHLENGNDLAHATRNYQTQPAARVPTGSTAVRRSAILRASRNAEKEHQMTEPETEPEVTEAPKTGKFLGVPYDWRRPTVERVKSRVWNPAEPRLFVPRAFGWGWDVNFARLLGRGSSS
jgi:hypothetical protein